VKSKSPNMMSWLRQVFQRPPTGDADENSVEGRAEVRYEARQESHYEPRQEMRQEMRQETRYEPRYEARQETRREPPRPAPTQPAASPAPAESTLAARLRRSREALAPFASQSPSVAAAVRALRRLENRLARLPRVVILGEFNSGKSSLVNVLLGSEFIPGPITRQGRIPVLIRYNSQPVLIAVDASGGRTQVDAETLSQWRGAPLIRVEAGSPSPALRRIEILDLPGMAHPTHDIGDLPLKASRNAHIAIWCTSATQAWKGSELRSWLALPERLRSYSLLAATHKDRLRVETDQEKVHARLRKEAAPFFRNVMLFSSVKARQARDASLTIAEPELWRESGADVFQASLADAVFALEAAREQAAARTAQRIAVWLLGRLQAFQEAQAPQGSDDGGADLVAAWSRHAEALAARVVPENVKDMAVLQEVAVGIQLFGTGVLEPWLRQRSWSEASARLLGLFHCDLSMISGAVDGLPPQAAVKRVHGALRQLHGELMDTLSTQTFHTAPAVRSSIPLSDVRRLLQPLLEAGKAA
jgi:hypothetical protein